MGDWPDQALFLARHREQIPEEMKFSLVLVNEAQDLSLAQMAAVRCVCKKEMCIAMDMNQRIYGKYWTPKLLGIETTTKKLTISMRTTKQIDDLAESIRSHNDTALAEEDRSLRAVPEKDGPKAGTHPVKGQPVRMEGSTTIAIDHNYENALPAFHCMRQKKDFNDL